MYVPVRRICEALEIDPSNQYRRLKDDEVTTEEMIQLEVDMAGGKQETNCLEARRLPYWLGGIDASHIKLDFRQTRKSPEKSECKILV